MDLNFRSISPEMPLSEVAKAFLTYKQGGFPVAEDGRVFGIITLEDLRTVPQEKWEKTRVKKVMTGAEKLQVLRPRDNAYDAFLKLTNNDLGRLPVVDNGEVVGMVTRNSIILLLAVKCDKCI
jgi:CBS domain-containing protein